MPDICGIQFLTKTRVALEKTLEKDGKRTSVKKKKKRMFEQVKREGVQ